MRFDEVLEEAKKLPVPYDVMGTFHDAYQLCQPFLQEINNKPASWIMYRGMRDLRMVGKGLEKDTGRRKTRLTDRRPKDTPEEGHESLNQYFIEEFGRPYRNGLFVSGNEMTAESYGKPYAVFPVGKFDYIWNPNIDDLTTDIYDYVEGTQDAIEKGLIHEHFAWVQFWHHANGTKPIPNVPGIPSQKTNGPTLEQMTAFIKGKTDVDLIRYIMLEHGDYVDDNLQSAISNGGEIMIWCEEYFYMEPVHLKHFQKFISK